MNNSNSISTVSESKVSDFSDSLLNGLTTSSTPEQYRFSGYQLPMDSDGNYVVPVHPYFLGQPEYYEKPCYPTNFAITSRKYAPSKNTSNKLNNLLPLS
jgi:hypothetical protein